MKFSFIFLVLLFLTWNLDYTTDSPKIKIEKYLNQKKKYDLCFYGDSKNMWNFNYEILNNHYNNVFNFSLGGASLKDMIEFYGENFCNCNINIINLNELTISNELIKNKLSFLLNSRLFFNPLNLNGSRSNFKRLIYNFNNADIKNGFFNLKGNKIVEFPDKFVVPDEGYLNNYFDFIKEKIYGKNVVFIIHPDRTQRKTNLNLSFGNDFLNNIHRNHFNQYPLINFSSNKTLQDEKFYYDTHHLNSKGSKLLTKQFLIELNKVLSK